MKCIVCFAAWDGRSGAVCPRCGFDGESADAQDAAKITAAKESYRAQASAYPPKEPALGRVRFWRRIGLLAIAGVLGCLGLRACAGLF